MSGTEKPTKGLDIYRLYFEPPKMSQENGVISREPQIARNYFKIVVVGDYAVGKSAIVGRFCDDFFREAHATTVGVDYKIRMVTLPDQTRVKLEIFDTAGLEKFRTVASNFYQNASGVVIVYDVTDENSFENVRNHLKELKYFIPPDAEILLMGNKADLDGEGERRVEFKVADEYSAKMGISLFEVSAKTGQNVEEAFVELTEKIREKVEMGRFEEDPRQIFDQPTSPADSQRSLLSCVWCCL